MTLHEVLVRNLPPWSEPLRLLGEGDWVLDGVEARALLSTHAAADLAARLRGLGIGGEAIELEASPPIPRAATRAARTEEARRQRMKSPGFSRKGARLDPEGRFSLTPELLALRIGQTASGRSVVDAGCGAGGNTIGFARAGCPVLAIEQDPARLADARHNARLYGVAGCVEFRLGDATRLLPELRAEILFVDPPWGLDYSRARVGLADLPLLTFALSLEGFAEIWAKVPPSFDVRALPQASVTAMHGVGEGDLRRIKFLILRMGGNLGTPEGHQSTRHASCTPCHEERSAGAGPK